MAAQYSMRDVVKLAGLSRNIVLRMVRSQVVSPERPDGREYRFGFQDLIVLRAARSLYASNIPPRRVQAALRRLRAVLPGTLPISGLRICAQGAEVVVHEGNVRWQADSGQCLLDFDARPTGDAAEIVEHPSGGQSEAARHFERACRLEDDDPDAACECYRRAIECDRGAVNAYLNLGCLLHTRKRWGEAEAVYRNGLEHCTERGTLYFNLAILAEDCGQIAQALDHYREALVLDPHFADAHHNLARLYAALGRTQEALRAYHAYRRSAEESET